MLTRVRACRTERIRHPERFDHLKSTYERGVAGNEKVGHGTAAMGEYSKFEQIGSSSVRASNPISLDMDRTDAEENSKSWQQNRRNAYNPILQKYQDEIDCSSGRYGAVNNQAFAPTPPSQQQMLTQNQQQFVEGNSQRERVLRTRDWTPGRPKGGRTYREKTQNSTPILGDKPEEATLVENERIRQEYYDKEKDRYVRVFQVYPDVMKEVNAMRADAQQKDMEINKALDRRMVRVQSDSHTCVRGTRGEERNEQLPFRSDWLELRGSNCAAPTARLKATVTNCAAQTARLKATVTKRPVDANRAAHTLRRPQFTRVYARDSHSSLDSRGRLRPYHLEGSADGRFGGAFAGQQGEAQDERRRKLRRAEQNGGARRLRAGV